MSTYGDILTIDLTAQRVSREPLAESVVRQYLGGRGLNAWQMQQLADPAIDPLSPQNVLLLSTGLLTGSVAPASARAQFAARSPQTGLLGASNGRHFGRRCARADPMLASPGAPRLRMDRGEQITSATPRTCGAGSRARSRAARPG